MKKKYQNIFFIFGVTILAIMIAKLDLAEVMTGIRSTGYSFFEVVLLWAGLYMINTLTWYLIIQAGSKQVSEKRKKISYLWLYKINVSGFALNYATPGGLMGGEPYKIIMLSPKIGTAQASSSVILYTMMHIFSHLWFWLLSVGLFLLTRQADTVTAIILTLTTAGCSMVIWFFLKGYKKGLAFRALNLLKHLPLIKRKAAPFIQKHKGQLNEIDRQIAALHGQNKKTFLYTLLLELGCRILSAFEIYIILRLITPEISYTDCILILAFTTLFANLLFFIPLQLGGREGGFLMSSTGLGITAAGGMLVALIVRVRELIWTGIGLLLIKWDVNDKNDNQKELNNQKDQLNK